jgi:hypothetical protein
MSYLPLINRFAPIMGRFNQRFLDAVQRISAYSNPAFAAFP